MVSAMESMGRVRLSPYCWLRGGPVEGMIMMEKPYVPDLSSQPNCRSAP